jgi:hypothetical protein
MTASQNILYGIQSGDFIKIGITRHLVRRLEAARLFNPHPLKVVIRRNVWGGYARIVEIKAHQLLAQYALGREWFNVDVGIARAAVAEAIAYGKERERQDREYQRVCAQGDGRTGAQIARDLAAKRATPALLSDPNEATPPAAHGFEPSEPER